MGRSLGRDFFDESIKDERANFTLADNYRNITKSQVLVIMPQTLNLKP